MANRSKYISCEIADQIKMLRLRSGMTQKELANRLYKSESTVRMWELGKSEPDTQAIKAMADIFSVSSDIILGTLNLVSIARRLETLSSYRSSSVPSFLEKYGVDEKLSVEIATAKSLIPAEVARQISLDMDVPLEFVYGKKFEPKKPVEQWPVDCQDEYRAAPKEKKDYIMLRHGGCNFVSDPENPYDSKENLKIAVFNGTDATDEMLDKVLEYAKFIKSQSNNT